MEAALVTMAGEHLLPSMADYQICSHSGYGRTAAMVSQKWQNYIGLGDQRPELMQKEDHDACYPLEIEETRKIMPGI